MSLKVMRVCITLLLGLLVPFSQATTTDNPALDGLSQATILLSREASQAADVMTQFLSDIEGPLHPPCFIQERTPETTDVDFYSRLLEDHQSAIGYSQYIAMVRESLAEEIEKKLQNNPVCDYCLYLDNLENTVSLMTQSLGNLIRLINETMSPTAGSTTPTQGADQSAEDTAEEKGQGDEGFCSSPCYSQQLQVYRRLIGFAAEYVSTDINGYLNSRK